MYTTPTQTLDINFWITPVVANRESNTEKRFITAQDVINATCRAFDVLKSALISKSRKKELVRSRYICMHVMRENVKVLDKKKHLKQISFKQIGSYFERDHTTVIHAIDTIENDLSVPAYRFEVNQKINEVINLL